MDAVHSPVRTPCAAAGVGHASETSAETAAARKSRARLTTGRRNARTCFDMDGLLEPCVWCRVTQGKHRRAAIRGRNFSGTQACVADVFERGGCGQNEG